MALNFGGVPQLFDHSREFEWGGGEIRAGMATVVVALDGSGDTSSIQEGIDLLPDTGGVVYIKEGTYTITEKITITIDNVALIGAGRSTKITTSSDIIMLEIIAGGAPTRSYILIENLFFSGSSGSANNIGINIDAVNSIISKCWFEDCGSHGIFWDTGGTESTIINNFFDDCVGSGIKFTGSRGLIMGNIISSCDESGIDVSGTDIRVIGNLCNLNVKHGIDATSMLQGVIADNVCDGNDSANAATYSGIYLKTADNNVISGNRCRNNDDYEINISDSASDKNIIIGNQCIGTHTTGAINDSGTNTHPNGASGTNNLALDDLNIIA